MFVNSTVTLNFVLIVPECWHVRFSVGILFRVLVYHCLQTSSRRMRGSETWSWEKRSKRISSHSCTWCQCWTGLVNAGSFIVNCITVIVTQLGHGDLWNCYLWKILFCLLDQLSIQMHEYIFSIKCKLYIYAIN